HHSPRCRSRGELRPAGASLAIPPLCGGSGWGPTKLKQAALPEVKAPLEVLAVSDQVRQRVPDRRSPAIAREPPDLALEPAECLIEAGKLPVKITPVPGIPDGGRGHVFPDRQAVECIHGLILRFRKKRRKTCATTLSRAGLRSVALSSR